MINKLDISRLKKDYSEKDVERLKGWALDFSENCNFLKIKGHSPKEENCFISSGDIAGVYFPNSIIKFFQYSIMAVASFDYNFIYKNNNSIIVLIKEDDPSFYYIDHNDFEAVSKLQKRSTFSKNYNSDELYIKKEFSSNIYVIYKSGFFDVNKESAAIYKEALIAGGYILTANEEYKQAFLEAKAARDEAFLKIAESYDESTLAKIAGYNKHIEATAEAKRERLQTIIGWEFEQGYKFVDAPDAYDYQKEAKEIIYFYENKNKYISDYKELYSDMAENFLQKGKNFYNSSVSEKIGKYLDKKTLEEMDRELSKKVSEIKKSDDFSEALKVKKALKTACGAQYKSVRVILEDGYICAVDPKYNYVTVDVLEGGGVRYMLNFGHGKGINPKDIKAITYKTKKLL